MNRTEGGFQDKVSDVVADRLRHWVAERKPVLDDIVALLLSRMPELELRDVARSGVIFVDLETLSLNTLDESSVVIATYAEVVSGQAWRLTGFGFVPLIRFIDVWRGVPVPPNSIEKMILVFEHSELLEDMIHWCASSSYLLDFATSVVAAHAAEHAADPMPKT